MNRLIWLCVVLISFCALAPVHGYAADAKESAITGEWLAVEAMLKELATELDTQVVAADPTLAYYDGFAATVSSAQTALCREILPVHGFIHCQQ